MNTPLSLVDIQKLLPGVPVITYPELEGKQHIEQVLGPDGRLVLLFLTTGLSEGHWVGIWRRGNTLCFFDSYGLAPDDERRWISGSKLVELHEDRPLLKNLFADAKARGFTTTFSRDHYQNESNNVETCGRHVAVRLNHADLSDGEYRTLIEQTARDHNASSPDEVVLNLTEPVLGK
jgi:hypothetical protein